VQLIGTEAQGVESIRIAVCRTRAAVAYQHCGRDARGT
jgi:hypothetical protein